MQNHSYLYTCVMRKLCLIGFFFSISLPLFAQYRTGLILPKTFLASDRRDSFCCVLFPDSNISIYENAGGKRKGKICRVGDPNEDEHYYEKLYVKTKGEKPELLGTELFQEVGYETFCYRYDDVNNGYVRIFTPQGNFWISVYELHKMDYGIFSWKDFIFKSSGKVLGFYPKNSGMNLFAQASSNSRILKKMRGDEFVITPTGVSKGSWCKVTVKHYKKNPCIADKNDEPNLIKTYEGWINVVDAVGNPLIWFYTHGC